MAQFGKHLFGSSFFGKTATFDGKYDCDVIDAGEPFDGSVTLAVTATLPSISYLASGLYLAYTDKETKWSLNETTGTASTWSPGAVVRMAATGSRFILNVQQGIGRATAAISLLNTNTNITTNYSINSAETDSLTITVPFDDYILTVTVAAGVAVPFTLKDITVQVTAIGAQIRTALTETGFSANGTDYQNVALAYDAPSGTYVGTSATVTAKQFVQVRLHLSTSDGEATPTVDKLNISSGDMNKYAGNGYWLAAINLKNAATDAGVTFARAKRVEWSEEEEQNSSFTIRSTSLNGSTLTTLPIASEVQNDAYWKAETAPYVVLRDGTTYGTPYSRISLDEAGNGSESSPTLSSVLVPINISKAAFSDTSISNWREWNDLSGLPTNANATNIRYDLYRAEDDIANGFAPVFSVESAGNARDRAITINTDDFDETLWLHIVMERPINRQSPVVHFVDLVADLYYKSQSGAAQYNNILCGLDNRAAVVVGSSLYPEQLGYQELRTVNAGLFNWPRLTDALAENQSVLTNASRRIRLLYAPKYPGQVNLGIGGTTFYNELTFAATAAPSFSINSKVTAHEPKASTLTASQGELLFHYSMDGGTVNFPLTTERELSNNFTPALLQTKHYRYALDNGWPDESFELPFSLSWQALSDMLDTPMADLQTANPDIGTYKDKIAMGAVLRLPNTSKNQDVQLWFHSNSTDITELSYLNGTGNETIKANIPNGGNYESFEWVSDEAIYTGVLNANDKESAYVRTQLASYQNKRAYLHTVTGTAETADALADRYQVSAEDIRIVNNNISLFELGTTVLIPGGLILPAIEPEVLYEGENPYVVEIIPGSVKRTKDGKILPEDILQFGSDDESGLQFTLSPSGNKTALLTRGAVEQGRETLPYSNILSVSKIVRLSTGTVYVPYSQVGQTEMGDYILDGNAIDWSPSHGTSKEPTPGDVYEVTFQHGIVDRVKIIYSSDYSEKATNDRLWRSAETKTFQGIVRPGQDVQLALPAKNTFAGFNQNLTGLKYIVEDNDLWVQTAIKTVAGEEVLYATMNGEDPKRNWYPTVQTGFYYLNDQEYYLYSEPATHVYGSTDLPIISDVNYTTKGLSLV